MCVQSLWGQKLFKCLLQKQGREKTQGPLSPSKRAGTQQQVCVEWTHRPPGAEGKQRTCSPVTLQECQDQSKEGISLPPPSPCFPNPGGVMYSSLISPVPYSLSTAPAWGRGRFDVESNLKWGLLSGTILSNFGTETRFMPQK